MKNLVLILFCFLSTYTMAQRPLPTPNDLLISTELLPGNQVAFRIYAPEAKKVTLGSGDIPDAVQRDLKKDSRGVWECIWSDAKPGAYAYHFVVDGVRVYDPKAPSAKETTAVLMVTEGDDVFSMKDDVPHGAISQRYYYSETLKQTRRLHVWTPAGFEKSKEKLPVLYLIHGGAGFDNSWSNVGCAGNILDNLLMEGKIKPMMVVMPNGTVDVKTPNILDRVPIFKDDLMTGLIPYIESNYNVYTDAAHRAIMGLSFGGLETLEVAMYHYDDFDYICPLSSGWWISDVWKKERGWTDKKEEKAARLKKIGADFNKTVKLLYFTQGGPEDLAYENGEETMKLFDAAGIKYEYSESPGGHEWIVWRKNLKDLAPLLFK